MSFETQNLTYHSTNGPAYTKTKQDIQNPPKGKSPDECVNKIKPSV